MRGARAALVVAALGVGVLAGRSGERREELPLCTTRDGALLVDLGRKAPDECLAAVIRYKSQAAGGVP